MAMRTIYPQQSSSSNKTWEITHSIFWFKGHLRNPQKALSRENEAFANFESIFADSLDYALWSLQFSKTFLEISGNFIRILRDLKEFNKYKKWVSTLHFPKIQFNITLISWVKQYFLGVKVYQKLHFHTEGKIYISYWLHAYSGCH